MTNAYGEFKRELNKLCERGILPKEQKKIFAAHGGVDNPGALIFAVCSDLHLMFQSAPPKSEAYQKTSEAIIRLVCDILPPQTAPDAVVVCAYIRLTAKANAADSPQRLFAALNAHNEEYWQSLQNIRTGQRLFAPEKDYTAVDAIKPKDGSGS